ncbi:unnamed protein product [Hermetia illucens]|uniref:Uncharacterized protein n=1 Tax=Hermetia illucens TaxID=343691 RepID=A0A7R8YTJ6_HERIL|nr:unnamed protein product [Hermetia illucens]
MTSFTGQGVITINEFIAKTEHYISGIGDYATHKAAVRFIYFEKIQGVAKQAIQNIEDVENWQLIKEKLKLRFKPAIESIDIFNQIVNIRINSVSELIDVIVRIKEQSEELIAYHGEEHYINLKCFESVLVNQVKEMTQGVLLDKIIELKTIDSVIEVMQKKVTMTKDKKRDRQVLTTEDLIDRGHFHKIRVNEIQINPE